MFFILTLVMAVRASLFHCLLYINIFCRRGYQCCQLVAACAQHEEKLNNQETTSLLKQKESTEDAVSMTLNTHHHGNNLYKESNIKTACEMEEARLCYKLSGW